MLPIRRWGLWPLLWGLGGLGATGEVRLYESARSIIKGNIASAPFFGLLSLGPQPLCCEEVQVAQRGAHMERSVWKGTEGSPVLSSVESPANNNLPDMEVSCLEPDCPAPNTCTLPSTIPVYAT